MIVSSKILLVGGRAGGGHVTVVNVALNRNAVPRENHEEQKQQFS